jgi:hypothetical protein
MKTKIILVIIAAVALTSFNSCALRIGGRVRAPHERREGRGRSDVQPLNNGLQNSFAPSMLQPSAQLPNMTILY